MPPAIGSHLEGAKGKIGSELPSAFERPTTHFAIQQFEHGWMFKARVDRPTVYVLFDSPNKTWKQFVEDWGVEDHDPADSCPKIPAEKPGNLRKPVRGFGQVWCGAAPEGGLSEDERLRSFGYSIHAEFGHTPATRVLYYQELDGNGILFGGAPLDANFVSDVSGTVIFILKKDHTWDMVGHV